MKRKALLIGNTTGLNGVLVDVEKTARFLKSATGGTWFDSEIEIMYDPGKAALLDRVQQLKSLQNDYAFVLFTGHGGHERRTVLQLNGNGETILDSQLLNIASRQLSIYDCCRVLVPRKEIAEALDSITRKFEADTEARRRYEERIMSAIPQQAQLFACSIGQTSTDTPKGAIYLNHLLAAAGDIKPEAQFKTAEMAHHEARIKTTRDQHDQVPTANLPKCLISQQLIIGIRA